MTAQKVEQTELIPQDVKTALESALGFIGGIKEIECRSQDEYNNAAQTCKEIKGYLSDLDNHRKALVTPYNDTVKKINARFKDVTARLENGERELKRAMSRWFQEEERKRIGAQKKADAEAAEMKRKAEERARKEREKAEQYAAEGRQDMAEKAEARAETQEDISTNLVAEEVENMAKVEGVSFRLSYTCTVEDKLAAALYCLKENQRLEHIVQIDEKAAEKLAITTKGAIQIPGIKYIEDKIPIIRKG